MTADAVLILAAANNPSAIRVQDQLTSKGVLVYCLDLEDFPQQWSHSAFLDNGWQITVLPVKRIPFSSIRAVYVRRPGVFRFSDSLEPDVREFCEREARAGVLGSLMTLKVKWVNHPLREYFANYKTTQLALAEEFGLNPPASLISNDLKTINDFIETQQGRAVYKGIGHHLSRAPRQSLLPTTRIVSASDVDASLTATSNLLQEEIPKIRDIRVTVVGKELFSIAITTPGSLDWRDQFAKAKYEKVETPVDLREKIIDYMAALGLSYGALDFAELPDSSWRFLEVNPNGQWLWLENHLNLTISEAVADELLA